MFLCGKGAFKMRILVANTPLIYRESFALSIHQHNLDFEVMIADPASVDGEAERFGPHALIRDDDGTEIVSPEGVVCWVSLIKDDRLKARISVNGEVSEVHEASLEEVLAVLDRTAKLLSEDGTR
jgi:hypothetical protein